MSFSLLPSYFSEAGIVGYAIASYAIAGYRIADCETIEGIHVFID